jgi:hypothetical protein
MLYRRFNFLGDSKIDGFFNKLLMVFGVIKMMPDLVRYMKIRAM